MPGVLNEFLEEEVTEPELIQFERHGIMLEVCRRPEMIVVSVRRTSGGGYPIYSNDVNDLSVDSTLRVRLLQYGTPYEVIRLLAAVWSKLPMMMLNKDPIFEDDTFQQRQNGEAFYALARTVIPGKERSAEFRSEEVRDDE